MGSAWAGPIVGPGVTGGRPETAARHCHSLPGQRKRVWPPFRAAKGTGPTKSESAGKKKKKEGPAPAGGGRRPARAGRCGPTPAQAREAGSKAQAPCRPGGRGGEGEGRRGGGPPQEAWQARRRRPSHLSHARLPLRCARRPLSVRARGVAGHSPAARSHAPPHPQAQACPVWLPAWGGVGTTDRGAHSPLPSTPAPTRRAVAREASARAFLPPFLSPPLTHGDGRRINAPVQVGEV